MIIVYQLTYIKYQTNERPQKFIKDYIEAQTMPEVMFTWHGGETLMRPISFYKKALRLQQQYAGGRRIDNCIQTNATMLTEEWCKFFHDNNFLIGVSALYLLFIQLSFCINKKKSVFIFLK